VSRTALIALVLVAAAIAGAIVFGGPLVRWYQGRAERAEAREETAVDGRVAAELETEGTRNVAAAEDRIAAEIVVVRERTHELEIQTRTDPAVAGRLPDSELARNRDHDAGLCARLRCSATSAAPRDAGASEGAMRP